MKFYKILILSLILTSFSHADIRSEFPSYSYVLTEFGLNENFVDNPDFKRFVEKNKNSFRKRFYRAVKRGGLIIPTIKEMMYQKDISPVFIYISMIESAFDPQATSRTGAGGLWQFTVNTGMKDFHLKINPALDERYDPIRATESAIEYLYRMNNNLNAWYLTTMAYNCGNGCVNKSLRKAGTRDLGVLISPRNNFIKEETRNYIQKILLMAMIGENYLFNMNDGLGEIMNQINMDSITPVGVRGGESLNRVASVLQMDPFYLKKINAHLKNGKTPYVDGYRINIPTSKVGMFRALYARSLEPNRAIYSRNNNYYNEYRK